MWVMERAEDVHAAGRDCAAHRHRGLPPETEEAFGPLAPLEQAVDKDTAAYCRRSVHTSSQGVIFVAATAPGASDIMRRAWHAMPVVKRADPCNPLHLAR